MPAQDASSGEVAADNAASIEFADGELLYSQGDMVAMLKGNATTGYEWTSAIEGPSVKADGDEYLAEGETANAAGEDVVAGAGGVHVFGYKAIGSGDAAITLKYARSWEASDSDKTVVVKVTVENDKFTKVTVE